MDTEKTLKAWLESMSQHTPTEWKKQMSSKRNTYFIINFINVCALLLIRAKKN